MAALIRVQMLSQPTLDFCPSHFIHYFGNLFDRSVVEVHSISPLWRLLSRDAAARLWDNLPIVSHRGPAAGRGNLLQAHEKRPLTTIGRKWPEWRRRESNPRPVDPQLQHLRA